MNSGRAGGATTRPTTTPCSSSPITRVIPWRWREGRRSTSSPTESRPHLNRPARPPAAKTSCFGAAATSFSSTWQRGCWTSLSSTSFPCCSAAVLVPSPSSGTRRCSSSRCGRSRPPASRTSSTGYRDEPRREFQAALWSCPAIRRLGGRREDVPPLGARRAKRFHFGGAWILHQSLVVVRFNSDQRDLAFAVVVNAPAVALGQRRHPQVRVSLAQELLAFFRPAGLRDVMEDGVHRKGNVFFGVRVRMADEQLVLDHGLRLLATSGLRHLSLSSRTVVGDLKSTCRCSSCSLSDDLVGEVREVGDGPGLDEAHRPLLPGLAEE